MDITDRGYQADMVDENGRVRPPLAPGLVFVPARAEIRGDRLVYWWDWTPPGDYRSLSEALAARRWAQPAPPTDLLTAFMRVQTESDIRRFALRFGPLELCEAGLPLTRLFDPPDGFLRHTHAPCRAAHVDEESGGWSEPLSIWVRLAERTRGMFELAAWLHTAQAATEPSDALLDRAFPEAKSVRDLRDLLAARGRDPISVYAEQLAERVNFWLQLWTVTPRLQWSPPNTPVLRVGQGAAEHLALQLASAIARAGSSWATCDGCSRPYRRGDRAAQMGRRNWCPDCKADGTMARLIKQAQRKKKGVANE